MTHCAQAGTLSPRTTEPPVVHKELAEVLANPVIAVVRSAEELAEALGLPVEQTVATVERYNELCDGGRDLDFFKKAKYMVRIDPPFYGAWNTLPQFFTVHGGLRTNTNMQVCDANDEPIPGLYNVGTMIGDFFSNIYTFRIQGQSYGSCLTFGYLTGKYIAENE